MEVFFVPRKTPYYVTIPINEGSWEAPVQVDETHLAAAESYLKTIYPVPDVNFERWEYPPFDIAPGVVTGAILRNDILENLIMYYDLLTALDVDPMPEQIYGYTVTADLAQAATQSPLCTTPGCGHVAGGGTFVEGADGTYLYNPTNMAHEINHNIGDPETWAQHVPGGTVGEGTVDPEWVRLYEESEGGVEAPYAEFHIREFGFDYPPSLGQWIRYPGPQLLRSPIHRNPAVLARNHVLPDGRSTRRRAPQVRPSPSLDLALPLDAHVRRYSSPTPPAFPDRDGCAMIYYVSGRMNRQGLVQLNPVMRLSGLPSVEPDSKGEFILEFQYPGGRRSLTVPFTPIFVDGEGSPLDTVYFRFALPAKGTPDRIVVRKDKEVLDQIIVSKHRPKVAVTEPRGDMEWNGTQKLVWQSKDQDDDPLTYVILYNPNVAASSKVNSNWIRGGLGCSGRFLRSQYG